LANSVAGLVGVLKDPMLSQRTWSSHSSVVVVGREYTTPTPSGGDMVSLYMGGPVVPRALAEKHRDGGAMPYFSADLERSWDNDGSDGYGSGSGRFDNNG
jgi:hypothetical protein